MDKQHCIRDCHYDVFYCGPPIADTGWLVKAAFVGTTGADILDLVRGAFLGPSCSLGVARQSKRPEAEPITGPDVRARHASCGAGGAPALAAGHLNVRAKS
jgi:hypothetical protein